MSRSAVQSESRQVDLHVNGSPVLIDVEPRRTLLDALRHDCGLVGAKKVCDMGNCGACTVLLDGQPVYACLVLAVECQGCQVTTIESTNGEQAGQQGRDSLPALQQAFLEHDALQCGYCTPAQLMSLKALFDHNPVPDDAAIAEAVAGNLCRCGAYRHIMQAARAVADQRSGQAGQREAGQ